VKAAGGDSGLAQNEKTYAFFMHSKSIYCWEKTKRKANFGSLTLLTTHRSIQFDRIDDANVYIGREVEEDGIWKFQYMHLHIQSIEVGFEPAFETKCAPWLWDNRKSAGRIDKDLERVRGFGFDQ